MIDVTVLPIFAIGISAVKLDSELKQYIGISFRHFRDVTALPISAVKLDIELKQYIGISVRHFRVLTALPI